MSESQQNLLHNQKTTMYVLSGHKYENNTQEYQFIARVFGQKDYIVDLKSPIYEEVEPFHAIRFTKYDSVYVNFVGYLFGKGDERLVSFPTYASNYFVDGKAKGDVDQHILEAYDYRLNNLMQRYSETLESVDDLFYTSNNITTSKMAYALKFFQTYEKFGLYQENQKIESETVGKTSWKETVNRILPDTIKDQTVYRRVIKARSVSKSVNITDLQIAILNYLLDNGFHINLQMRYNYLNFDFSHLDTPIELEDILNNDEEKKRWVKNLKQKRDTCFKDSDLAILDIIITFLKNDFLDSDKTMQIKGVMKFDRVFEAVLSEYFGNNVSIQKQNDSEKRTIVRLSSPEYGNGKNIDIVQTLFDTTNYKILADPELGKEYVVDKDEREDDRGNLIPDIVFEKTIGTGKSKKTYVVIMDAKYRNYKIKKSGNKYVFKGIPQNFDVFKQLQYENAIKRIYNKKFNLPRRSVSVINMMVLPWKRKYNEEEYDSVNFVDGLNTFGIIGYAKNKKQIILYTVVNFDAIVTYLLKGIKASDNRHDIYLIDESLNVIEHIKKNGSKNEKKQFNK